MTIFKVQCVWTGFIGAPGYTTLYFGNAGPPPVAAIRQWFFAQVTALANVVTIQVPAAGDSVDEATGVINGAWTAATSAAVTGTGGTAYSAPSGYIVNHTTPVIVNGRRVRGRSFMVPAASAAYDTTGTITTGVLANIQAANAAFLTAVSGTFVVWHRPVGGAGGVAAGVTAISTPDKACVLRSRRD
ncbi:MAG TPA: hypothetical protein VFE93_04985 [Myxococcaceae bacterium]|nr:hypothetical protein [Myxococcaceae bacterium]